MMIAKALAKSAGSSLVLMVLLANGETTSAPDVGDRAGEECLVVQGRGLPLQVQLNNGVSGKLRAYDITILLLRIHTVSCMCSACAWFLRIRTV